MNFTLLSLSLSSIYSASPIFVGNNNCFHKFLFKKYISPTVILNPNKLLVEKSVFSNGIGGFLYSNQNEILLKDSITEFIGKNVTNSNLEDIYPPNEKSLIIVRDCSFIRIDYLDLNDGKNQTELRVYNYLFKILSKVTFYMTNCLFDTCYFEKSILFLNSRATTVSHICCTNLYGGKESEALFLETDTPTDSFFKFIYSTIIGNNEYILPKTIFFLRGNAALRFQCINTSNFILDKTNERSILRISCTSCSSILMNTFYQLDAQYILRMTIDWKYEESFLQYCGLTNFVDNKQQDGIVYLDMHAETTMTFDKCYFSNMNLVEEGEKIIQGSNLATVNIINCFFKTFLNDNDLINFASNNCSEHIDDFQTLTLAHYTIEGKCDALHVIEAFGCQNDKCPNGFGCLTYGFTYYDVFYTEVFHPDIDTPTPTPTDIYSMSSLFTRTQDFSKSNDFSKSSSFSISNDFTDSESFTKTSEFSETFKFSKSSDFSQSNIFLPTLHFDATDTFTPSNSFTKSNFFINSINFSISDSFSESKKFSKSEKFSKSKSFSNSKEFSFSNLFTFSQLFTKSEIYTHAFSDSSFYTNSFNFTQSSSFTGSETFTSTPTQSDENNIISYSIFISQTITMVKTVVFSHSYSLAISNYECVNENGSISLCQTMSNSFYLLPYVILSISQSSVFLYLEEEIKYKKKMSKEVFIGIVCGSVSVLFSIIGIIIISKNRQKMIEVSDTFSYSSDTDDIQTIQTNVQMDDEMMKNVVDDNWL